LPTPNPSLLPQVVTQAAGLFTDNWTVFLAAAIALIAIIVIPTTVARGGLHAAIRGLRKVFGIAGS
jgi:hypothetical protein